MLYDLFMQFWRFWFISDTMTSETITQIESSNVLVFLTIASIIVCVYVCIIRPLVKLLRIGK